MVEAFWAPVRNIEPASQMQNRKYDSEAETTPDRLPTLSISTEKVCFVVVKAREFDVKDVATIPDDGSNPTDDCVVGVLEDRGDDPVVWELTAFIGAMSEDEQVDLVTLMWLGRGDGGVQEWDELRAEASRAHNRHTALYLLRTPLLPDYLEDALAAGAYRVHPGHRSSH